MDDGSDPTRLGWQMWQSRDGNGNTTGRWYATRLDTERPAEAPAGWAMTVSGDDEGEVRDAISRQIALDRNAFWRRLRM